MVSEEAKKETKNNVATFQILVQQDPFLVDHVSFPRSRSLLHFAAENGRVEIARELLSVAPEMRWWQDDQGMNPVHIAAIRGHVEILKLLLQLDLYPAMERLNRGQTVMHLCVKHRQLETLECLVEEMSDLVNVKDDDGDTRLHLAVRCDQVEMVKYLVDDYKVENLTENSMGKTQLDILRGNSQHTTKPSEIERLLLLAYDPIPNTYREMTDMTMVVVGLIATAFSAAVNPPGGVWQDDTSSHRAAKAIMASSHLIRMTLRHWRRSSSVWPSKLHRPRSCWSRS
ncbi:ankyrin repeat-containing protein BDA1-like [Salvia hispanica]|uniref:ankyrin repeat-containing protein BDA1-like n=1 Tax=Salvia hispanica TaxID=49212 RepID=UPI0020095567|nr:ankyrin repeat-containing protein BDA1-like [Salvia hispanica]